MRNAKFEYTEAQIRNAYMELIKKYDPNKVPVRELCDLAGINKSSFYAHYVDIIELQDKVTVDFLNKLTYEILNSIDFENLNADEGEFARALIKEAFRTTLENRELCRVLISKKSSTDIVDVMMDILLEYTNRKYAQLELVTSPDYKLQNTLIIGGPLIMWYRWIKNDFDVPVDEMADSIIRYIRHSTQML